MGIKYRAVMHAEPGFEYFASVYHMYWWGPPDEPFIRGIHFIGVGHYPESRPINGPYEFCSSLNEAKMLAEFYHAYPRVVRKCCGVCNDLFDHPTCRPLGGRRSPGPTVGYAKWGIMTVMGNVDAFPYGGPWPWEQQFLA